MRLRLVGLLLLPNFLYAAEIEKISLPQHPDLERADVYVLKCANHPRGVLVLCPGCNGNGEELIEQPSWQRFASDNDLDLAGLSFASDVRLLQEERGYYYARLGSGQLLLDGLQKIGDAGVPLLLYGFSGGAHFTAGFEQWKPSLVTTWCAYSAGWWDKPRATIPSPPGLVICGDDDERLGASLVYFMQGRALSQPWLWICAPHTGHSIYSPVEPFIRNYFSAVLQSRSIAGVWVDLDTTLIADSVTVHAQPSLTGWLPDRNLLASWQAIHAP